MSISLSPSLSLVKWGANHLSCCLIEVSTTHWCHHHVYIMLLSVSVSCLLNFHFYPLGKVVSKGAESINAAPHFYPYPRGWLGKITLRWGEVHQSPNHPPCYTGDSLLCGAVWVPNTFAQLMGCRASPPGPLVLQALGDIHTSDGERHRKASFLFCNWAVLQCIYLANACRVTWFWGTAQHLMAQLPVTQET